jgi:hypothetical protein
MAYMLYKYIRRKIKENNDKKAAHNITDESHLTPEFSPVGAPNPEPQETFLPGEGSHLVQPRLEEPNPAKRIEKSRNSDDEARRMRAYRWRMILGLILPNFLASVDVTIVAPAIPTISSHFSTCPFRPVGTKLIIKIIFLGVSTGSWQPTLSHSPPSCRHRVRLLMYTVATSHFNSRWFGS